jgi:hypothetical protein
MYYLCSYKYVCAKLRLINTFKNSYNLLAKAISRICSQEVLWISYLRALQSTAQHEWHLASEWLHSLDIDASSCLPCQSKNPSVIGNLIIKIISNSSN